MLVARNSLTCPPRQALATAFGIAFGSLVHATLCTLGLTVLLAKSVALFTFVKMVGASYLIFLGLKALFSGVVMVSEPSPAHVGRNISVCSAFLEGLLCNLLNPKLAIFLLSLFTQFLSTEAPINQRIGVAVVFVGENFVYWPLLVLLLQADRMRQLLHRGQVHVERVCGGLLIALGLKVAFSRE